MLSRLQDKKKIVMYLRVSSLNQVDNTSIEDQQEKIELYCKLNEYEIVNIFKDEAKSAKDTEFRDDYNKMIKFVSVKENNIDAILVFKSDRIHRSLKNLLIMIDKLLEHNVDFVSVTEQFDTTTAQGMLMVQMLGSFAEFERKQIGSRTKSGRIATARKGKVPGGRPPLGYEIKNNELVKIDKEAEIVNDIFKKIGRAHV